MNMKKVYEIRHDKETPLIGVIGATNPSADYTKILGRKVGYALREFIDDKHGTIFTGGVKGVGVDVYSGVVRFCYKKEGDPQHRFFVLVPEKVNKKSYHPPTNYDVLGCLSPEGKLNVVRSGQSMVERRSHLAATADALVVINGGNGTLEEAMLSANYEIPIIVMNNSGGAAKILSSYKENRRTITSENSRINLRLIDPDNIHPCDSIEILKSTLEDLL